MAIIKCKMCGGDLNILEDSSVCECEYCGTKQTVPKVDDEKKLKLFTRAGKLLRGCEFDKAAGVFESIISDFPEEAEAYWGLILSKYGIEYVDDPATGKKIPTCHRSSFESVEDDPNFEQACENADAIARRVYREEARQIETLRKRILEVSGKEEPYDIFISYKELDEDGERTPDSVIAQEIYRTLTKEGYRVFFSRISLEGKLGVEYEPYIFAALNSAKVMIVVGTDYEYFDAVWVKNEWSRFLKLIASGQKKTLIPVYKDMDPYDMPKELRSLAAQNMGKIGAMQDLLHGVEKVLGGKQEEKAAAQQVVQQIVQGGGPNVTALLDRGYMALEDRDWEKAKSLFDQVLNMDARNANAYLGLTLAEEKCSNTDEYIRMLCSFEPLEKTIVIERDQAQLEDMLKRYFLPNYLGKSRLSEMLNQRESYGAIAESVKEHAAEARERFSENRDLTRAFRYAAGDVKNKLDSIRAAFEARLDSMVKEAEQADEKAESEAQTCFSAAVEKADQMVETAFEAEKEAIEQDYQDACKVLNASKNSNELSSAIRAFGRLSGYKDSAALETRAIKAREDAVYYERVTKEIERYQQKVAFIEKELQHAPLFKRGELKQTMKWYQNEIEKLKKG